MTKNKDIAVVGMALRFPNGINSLDKLWTLLSNGSCAISEIPTNRWPTDLYQDSIKSIPGRSVTFKAGVLDSIKEFDATFFGISPKEAEWLDPQQRLLLEVTQECLEDAGIKVSDFKGSDCGVYTGISSLDYGLQAPKDLPSISAYTMTGNTLSIASNRISYVFDLHGPSVSMDTACSSSLVSLHHACQAIRTGEVPCAIVAGAHLLQDPYSFVGFSKASMLSPTGTCHPFANDANGYVRSEGVAVLLLKPLEDAIKDHNKIHAVIKASGVNTDGSRKNGLTIPSDIAQQELMEKVLFQSGLKATDIDYVEAHGTGTPVGDPIEAKSISSVYAINRQSNQVLPISSAKGNLGHMEPMSGLASFIKAVLSLKHGYIPPIPFDFVANPNIDFEKLKIKCTPKGLKINAKNIRTAGINSFGFGGANAHVIVQNYNLDNLENSNASNNNIVNTTDDKVDQKIANYFLFVSAKSKKSLKDLCLKHIQSIESIYDNYDLNNELVKSSVVEKEDLILRAYAYKSLLERDLYNCRVVFYGSNKERLITEINNFISDKASSSDLKDAKDSNGYTYAESHKDYRKIAFVFNGNGSQYVGMGAKLYKESVIFASCIDSLSDKIESYIGFSIKNLLSEGDTSQSFDVKEIIQNTKIAQPLIFAIQIALCKLLKINGVSPKAVIGHSMGEIAAAYVSSKLTLDEAIKVICIRSMLQDTTRGQGRMAAVSVSKAEFNDICHEMKINDVSVAAINSRDNITISGNTSTLELLENYFVNKKIFFKLLDVDYPFHSSYMNVIKDSVLNELHDVGTCLTNTQKKNGEVGKDVSVSFYSSVVGTKCNDDFMLNNAYWWSNIREEVNFYDGVKSLLDDGFDYFIEIGSNAILQRYLRDIAKEVTNENIVKETNLVTNPRISSTLLQKSDNLSRLINVVMECHLACGNLDKSCFFNGFNNDCLSTKQLFDSIDLPHYAWEKKHYEYHNSSEKAPEHYRELPLLGWKASSSAYVWDNVLEPSKNQLLRDHIVDGQYVVAAADYIEMVLEAINSMFGSSESENKWLNVEHIDILSPIAMDSEECYKSVRVRILSNTQDFEILSRDYLSNDEWLLNVKGRLLPTTISNAIANEEQDVNNKDKITENTGSLDCSYNFCDSCVLSLDSSDIYELTEKLGLTYGYNFRQLRNVDIAEGDKMLKVSLVSLDELSKLSPISVEENSYYKYVIHPGIIDSGFQGLLAAIIGNHYDKQNSEVCPNELKTYLPIKFGNISIRENSKVSYIIGKLLNITSRSLLAEFRLFNADNECIGVLKNCRFNALPKADSKNNLEYKIRSWHYEQHLVHHDLLPVIDCKEFTPTKINEFLSKIYFSDSLKQQRSVWNESVLPLIENAILYYSLSAIRVALTSVDNFILSKDTKESLHPLVSYIIYLLVEHEIVEIDEKNQIQFISTNEESSGDEILRYAYEICPEAIYEILPIYRLGNKLPLIISELLGNNSFSSNVCTTNTLDFSKNYNHNSLNSMLYGGIYKALAKLIVTLNQSATDDKHVLRVLEFGNNGVVQAIVNKEFNGYLSNIQIVSLDDSDFVNSNLSIKEDKQKQIRSSIGKLDHNTFDLVVINEQLRYVKDYENALLNINKLLSDKGLLVVIERNSDWSANVLNGVDKSWWLTDNTSILKASSYWKSLLQSSSFKDIAIYTEPASAGMQTGPYLIVTQKDFNNSNEDSIIKSSKIIPCVSDNTPLETFEDILAKLDNQVPNAEDNKNNKNILFIVPTNCQSKNFGTGGSKQGLKLGVIEELLNKVLNKNEVLAELTNYLNASSSFSSLNTSTDFNVLNISSKNQSSLVSLTKNIEKVNITSIEYNSVVSNDIDIESQNEGINEVPNFEQLLKSTVFNKVVFVASCLDEVKAPYVLQKLTKIANCINEINSSSSSSTYEHENIALSVITLNANFDSPASAIRGMVRVIDNELANVSINSINVEIPYINASDVADNSNEYNADDKDINSINDSVRDFDITPIWRELIASDGLDEVTIELSKDRKTFDTRYRTVIKEDFSDFTSVGDLECSNSLNNDKAYYLDFTAPGRLKNLCWVEKQLPKVEDLAPNEVLVDVKVTGVNFRDIMMTMGLVPDDALENGFSGPFLGLEFSGIISALGSDVKDFQIGDRVLGFGSSCFSNKLVVNDYSIASIPNEWSFESAATAPIVFFTAWYSIKTLANMEKGESILIHGAAGGVGIAAIQIAQYLGLEVYATAGSESKRDFLRMLGVEHIYNSRELDFRTELLRDTNGQGVDAVLNCLSGEAMRESLSVLKPFGRFMELGKRDFVENTSLGLRYFKENISYFAIDVDQLFKFNPAKAKNIFNKVIDLFKNGEFTPLPYIAFSNTDIVNAFKYMQQGNQTGKVVVTYDNLESFADTKTKSSVSIIKNSKNTTNLDNSFELRPDLLRDINNVISSEDVWLISGGTRGFGWATAKYLLDKKNVKQVVLVSRSGMTDESVIKESKQYLSLSNNACSNTDRIVVKRCDVSDKNAINSLWQDLIKEDIKVTGIIHAAAVFADCLLQDITLEHYQKVWNSKYIGAKNLHEVSKTSSSVKNFVVYSSISVAIGNIGQANYVATNSALEALVNRRIQEGFNACCIEWGPISDVGYLEGNEQVKKSLELAIGAEALNSADALAQLPEVIIRGGTQIIANLNWASISESVGKVSSRIYALVQNSKNQFNSISTSDLLSVIKDKSKAEAVNIIADILVSEIADTMGFTTDQINKEQNLQDIGLDSLMAMDLIVSIEKQTGIKLSVMAFQDNPNVNKLAFKIYQKMIGSDDELTEGNNSSSVLNQVLATHVQNSDLGDFLVNKEETTND